MTSAAGVKLTLSFDVRRFNRQIRMVGWQLARLDIRLSRSNERARQSRLLRIDREHQKSLGLDIQIVTMSDGVTRVVSRPLGQWHISTIRYNKAASSCHRKGS